MFFLPRRREFGSTIIFDPEHWNNIEFLNRVWVPPPPPPPPITSPPPTLTIPLAPKFSGHGSLSHPIVVSDSEDDEEDDDEEHTHSSLQTILTPQGLPNVIKKCPKKPDGLSHIDILRNLRLPTPPPTTRGRDG